MKADISARQLCAVCFAALFAPGFMLCTRMSWHWVLLAAAVAGLYYYIVSRLLCRGATLPRTGIWRGVLLLAALALACLAGYGAKRSAGAFPETDGNVLAGLLVLALAVFAARLGVQAVARCGSLLFFFVALIAGIILVFSAPRVRPEWIAPWGGPGQGVLCLLLFLLPGAAVYLQPRVAVSNTRPGWWLLAFGLSAAGAALVTSGCLSPAAAVQPDSFYVLSGGASLLGVAERFEALLSAAYLAGYFCAAALLLCAARSLAQNALGEKKFPVLWAAAAVAAAATAVIPASWLVPMLVVGGVFCGLFPLVLLWVGAAKKV
ncbi:MAG: hypothetical protein ACI3VX_03405 [Faecousia sp.]